MGSSFFVLDISSHLRCTWPALFYKLHFDLLFLSSIYLNLSIFFSDSLFIFSFRLVIRGSIFLFSIAFLVHLGRTLRFFIVIHSLSSSCLSPVNQRCVLTPILHFPPKINIGRPAGSLMDSRCQRPGTGLFSILIVVASPHHNRFWGSIQIPGRFFSSENSGTKTYLCPKLWWVCAKPRNFGFGLFPES